MLGSRIFNVKSCESQIRMRKMKNVLCTHLWLKLGFLDDNYVHSFILHRRLLIKVRLTNVCKNIHCFAFMHLYFLSFGVTNIFQELVIESNMGIVCKMIFRGLIFWQMGGRGVK